MFDVAFILLFLAAALALFRPIHQLTSDKVALGEPAVGLGALVVVTVVMVLVLILTHSSDFPYKTAALIFFLGSLSADWIYTSRRTRRSKKYVKSRRRIWWEITDNTIWVVLVLLLYAW